MLPIWSFSYPDTLFPAVHYNIPCLCNASWDQKETESDQDDEVIQTLSSVFISFRFSEEKSYVLEKTNNYFFNSGIEMIPAGLSISSASDCLLQNRSAQMWKKHDDIL